MTYHGRAGCSEIIALNVGFWKAQKTTSGIAVNVSVAAALLVSIDLLAANVFCFWHLYSWASVATVLFRSSEACGENAHPNLQRFR